MKTRFAKFLALWAVVLCITALATGPQHGSALAQDPTSAAALIENVDLGSWQSRDGRTLFEVMKQHSLALLVIVDPNCATCTKAQADLRDLRDRTEKAKIKYFVLMIPSESDTSKYFAYADSLKLDAEAFVWSNKETKPLAPVATMVAPSHLLVSSEGHVAKKWAGIPEKF
jgi:hypothetical protein